MNKNKLSVVLDLVKRSKSLPVGTSSPRRKRIERFDELDTLLSDEENSDRMGIRGRTLTSPRTSPSSPRHSPKSSPTLSLKVEADTLDETSLASSNLARTSPSPDISSKVSETDSSELGEDSVDRSVLNLRSAIETLPKRKTMDPRDRYKDSSESDSDQDKAVGDESSNSSESQHKIPANKISPLRKLSQYQTMAEYLEEITGAKDIPGDCIASTLSSQVREHMERRNSISEAKVETATSKSSLSNISREVSILENAEENVEICHDVPEISITAESPSDKHSVEILTDIVPEVEITSEENTDEQVELVARQQSNNSDWELYPNVDSMASVSVALSESTRPTEIDDDEKGLILISAGLLELLSQIVVSLPNTDLLQVLGIILKPEILLILAHHAAPEIRVNAVKVCYLNTLMY